VSWVILGIIHFASVEEVDINPIDIIRLSGGGDVLVDSVIIKDVQVQDHDLSCHGHVHAGALYIKL